MPVAKFPPINQQTLTGLINDLKSSIKTYKESKEIEKTQFFTDRRYHKRSNDQGQNSIDTKTQTQHKYQPESLRKGKCYVCKKPGCWSRNHSESEQQQAKAQFKEHISRHLERHANQYIAEYEGQQSSNENDFPDDNVQETMETLVLDIDSSPLHLPDDELPESSIYFSSVTSVINPRALTQFL
ncbi:hypothetical protein K3495_g15550 [Podosphaera aphanis]|nr:hypothetical protein K3495_g15550 [Podosphaera aphanis]